MQVTVCSDLEKSNMTGFNHTSGKYVNIGSAKIYNEVIGAEDYSPLLFLHGGFGNIENFNDIMPDLLSEYKVIGIDCRGQGKSTLGIKELTYELLQKDIETVLNHLGIDELNILGFSHGGVVSYRLASFSDINIKKLITIGSRWNVKKYSTDESGFFKNYR